MSASGVELACLHCRDVHAPAFLLEVRLGQLRVRSHPSLVDWGGARGGMMSADGWAAAARHRRRRLAATRMYAQVRVSSGCQYR
jgi:hypothetical protein